MKKILAIIIVFVFLLPTGGLFAHPIHDAAKDGDFQKVEKLLEENPNLLNLKDEDYERTPLHWAAAKGHKSIVEYLVSKGAVVDDTDKQNFTPFRSAVDNGHSHMADYLRGLNADPHEDQHYHVHGTEQFVPGIYFTGNPPTPTKDVFRTAYISAAILLFFAAFLQCFLRKRLLTRKDNQEDEKEADLRKNTRIKSFLITLTIVVFYFAALETILQLYVIRNPYRKFIPDPVSHWKIDPNFTEHTKENGSLSHYNGVYDTEFPVHKEKEAYRILCYGDSQTYGIPWVETMKGTYPKKLQNKLRKEFPQKKIEIINMGIAGYTTYQGLIFHKNVGTKFNPDCVILAYGYHDGNVAYAEDKNISTDNAILISIRRLLYRSQLYLLIRTRILERRAYKIEDSGEPIFSRVSLEDYRKNIEEFIELGKNNGFRTILMILPQQHEHNVRHPQYADECRKIADNNDILLIDCTNSVKDTPIEKQNIWFYEDKCHMTEEGNEKVSEIMFNNLKPFLKREFKSDKD